MAGRDDTLPLPDHSGAFVLDAAVWPTGGDLERYVLDVLLGSGGMGEVWQAEDRHLNRLVALKRVKPGAPESLQARLKREARITASLEHPGIVPVHDAGTDEDGLPWFAMRIVRGRSLADVLRDQDPLAREGLLRHVLHVCEAVAYAHHVGVVHRDLKPANLWIGAFGETQVMDWGLARPLEHDRSWEQVLSTVGTLTEAGMVLGTPAYMSPEQAVGEPADKASDVWSLGVILWEVVAGERAFKGLSSQEVLRRVIASSPPPLSQVVPDVPPELEAIVERATRHAADRRYPDADALARDLQAFLDGRRVSAYRYTALDAFRQTARRWRVALLVGASGLAGLLLAGAVGVGVLLQEQVRLRQAEDALQSALATSDARLGQALTQRALLALEGGDLGRAQLLAAQALTRGEDIDARGVLAEGSGHPRRLLQLAAPDCELGVVAGGGLVCSDATGLSRLELDGSRTLLSPHSARRFIPKAWSSELLVEREDGYLYASDARGQSVPPWRVPAEQIHQRWGASLVEGVFLTAHSLPETQILGPGVPERSRELVGVRKVDPCDGVAVQRGALIAPEDVVVWCSDGRLRRGSPDGPEDVARLEGGMADSVAVDVEGRTVAFGEITGGLRVLDLAGERPPLERQLGPARVSQVALSADGAWVAAVVPGQGLHLLERDSGRAHRVPTAARHVCFDRDGRLLVWTGTSLEAWAMPGADAPRVQSTGTSGVVALSWNGPRLTVTSGAGVTSALPSEPQEHRRLPSPVHDPGYAVKAATRDRDGVLWVAAHDGLFRWGSSLEKIRDGNHRRVLALADGTVLAGGRRTALLRGSEVVLEEAFFNTVEAASSPDGRTAVMISRDGRLARVQVGPSPRFEPLAEVDTWALAVADSGRIFLGGRDGVRILESDGIDRPWASTETTVLELALSPDGRWLAAADAEQRVWVFRTSDGTPVARLRGHVRRVGALAFSPDGRWLASGSWDDTVRFWDTTVLEAPAQALRARMQQAWGVPTSELSPEG